jgi:hypothetical protein
MASRLSSSNSFGTFLDTLQQRDSKDGGKEAAAALQNMQTALSSAAATSALMRILGFLKDAAAPTGAPDIVKFTKVDPSTALGLIRDASATGLISEQTLPDGTKAFSITSAGVEMLSFPAA